MDQTRSRPEVNNAVQDQAFCAPRSGSNLGLGSRLRTASGQRSCSCLTCEVAWSRAQSGSYCTSQSISSFKDAPESRLAHRFGLLSSKFVIRYTNPTDREVCHTFVSLCNEQRDLRLRRRIHFDRAVKVARCSRRAGFSGTRKSMPSLVRSSRYTKRIDEGLPVR